MRPIRLQVRNFLSYGDDVPPLAFDGMHVVCLSGPNGHGKSALLDAITWALWGKSRASSDDDLIHHGRQEMLVDLEFLLEDQRYRVRRERIKRGKSSRGALEFFVWDEAQNTWRPLTGTSMRETQKRIIDLLRLDYETFVNSAFLRQGRADEFTVKRPGERKRILAEILHLDRYAELEKRAKERMRRAEQRVEVLSHQQEAIAQEIAQEERFRQELAEAQSTLADLVQRREEAEAREQELQSVVNTLRQLADMAKRQASRVAQLQAEIRETEQKLAGLRARLDNVQRHLAQREEIEARYQELQRLREENARWDALLRQQAELQHELQEAEAAWHEARVVVERRAARLAQAMEALRDQAARREDALQRLAEAQAHLDRLDALEQEAARLRERISTLVEERSALQASLRRLKEDMEELKERIDRLEGAREEANCPLCGQPLTDDHIAHMVTTLRQEGQQMGERFRQGQSRLKEITGELKEAEAALKDIERELRARPRWQTQHAHAERDVREAEQAAQRLAQAEQEHAQIVADLNNGAFAPEEQARVQALREKLAALGYDAVAHQQVREALTALDDVEQAYRTVLLAEQQVSDLEKQIRDLEEQHQRAQEWLRQEQKDLQQMQERLRELPEAEKQWRHQAAEVEHLAQMEREAHARVGALRQQLAAIEAQKKHLTRLEREIREERERATIYQELAQAFGRNGLQAMIIEAALPEIEEEANRLLARMTGGRMTVRLKTQRELRSGEAAETLDIEIADDLGVRPYEMYSGGEAFRINFALRIALSKLLARRAGASLRSLFIDEGFGSQDSEGRLRLVDAINSIQDEFDLIVVITHIEELKEAFPVRIEVFKGPEGSTFTIS